MVSGLRDEEDQSAGRMSAASGAPARTGCPSARPRVAHRRTWPASAGTMVFVEALAGLDRLPPRGAWFLFLPLNLVDGTGAPGRALAVLP
jgi:kynurenine formamidase